ncbi:MAG: DUF2258 domain-containing protein [Euryarchaeota archaeon]|nr:DUF2258 domain-containing protein [Euryarchaeota archaeon]
MLQRERVGSLSTGFIVAAGYANKIRRTAFAQMKDYAEAKEIVRATAALNMALFDVLREFNIEKTDVIRIRISYRIFDGKISWDPETLEIEVFKRSEVNVDKARDLLKKKLEETPSEEASGEAKVVETVAESALEEDEYEGYYE